MGRMKPRITAVAMPPYGVAHTAVHDRSRGEVRVLAGLTFAWRIRLHKTRQCADAEHCVLHNPSDHPLKEAPMTLRADRDMLIERVCEHGLGHPDPDSLGYLQGQARTRRRLIDGAHGCDGCCLPWEAFKAALLRAEGNDDVD